MILLVMLIHLIVGLLISAYWFRRRRRLGTNDTSEDPFQAVIIVFCWPLFLIGWPIAAGVRWLYFH